MQLDQAVALAYFQAGNSRFSARDFKSATALFSKAAEIMPGTPLYLNGLAGALYETGEIDLALRHLEQALRILPDYPEARQNLALILQRRADRQD
jgi:tetratricopeptide (TPR) repeat protein